MKHLLEKDGLQVLEAFCYANTLFAFDYDGTLAPIVDDPDRAKMRDVTAAKLRDIASIAPTAVISGRRQSDVGRFLPEGIDYIIGNHGLEGLPGGSASLEQAEASCEKWSRYLTDSLKLDGVFIENKLYSLAVHYRKSNDKRGARAQILNASANLEPSPRIVLGKCVVNLVSAGAPHKGVALLELMLKSGCRSAIYIGDDDNDEDVFRLGEESLLTIRVGENENSSAQFFVKSQEEVDEMLRICSQAMTKVKKKLKNPLTQEASNETRRNH